MDSTAVETSRVKRKKHKKEKKKKHKREKKEYCNSNVIAIGEMPKTSQNIIHEWSVENNITKSSNLNTTKCDATFNNSDSDELEEDDFYDLAEEEVEFEPSFLHFKGHCIALTAKQKEEAREEGIVIKYGKWDEKEDEILKRNWKNFVKRYSLKKPHYLLGLQRKDPNVIKFVQAKKFYYQLGKDLDNRPLHSTYLRARKLFNPYKNRNETTSDVLDAIEDLISIHGNSWTVIGNLLQRTSYNVSEIVRWHRKEKELGHWSQEEDENLIQAIKKVLRVEDVTGIYQGIPWEKVDKLVPSRNAKQCRVHWLLNLCWNVNNPNVPREKWKDENTVKLINCIYHLSVESEKDIDWIEIFNKFSNVASYSALHAKWAEIKRKVPRYEEKDFEDIVLYLYKVYVPILVKKLGKSNIDEVLSAS